jgi:two-component system sensor histidine kinase DesK
MITLKSELARQLVTEEPSHCAQELSEIERVARQTLREVREAVAGYRQPDLRSELEGARQLLEAAGIEGEIDSLQEALPSAIDAALAWTVREGVTNVIRHSRAWRCRIHLTCKNGLIGAEVLSDGGRREHVEGASRPGLGLAGLRERVSALGGRMEAGASPSRAKNTSVSMWNCRSRRMGKHRSMRRNEHDPSIARRRPGDGARSTRGTALAGTGYRGGGRGGTRR